MNLSTSSSPKPWTPILSETSDIFARAWDAVNSIAHAVEKRSYPPPYNRQVVHFRPYEEPLLYGYLSLALKDRRWLDLAAQRLNAVIERAGYSRGNLGLFGGLCGLGWTVEHLSKVLEDFADSAADNGSSLPASDDEDEDLNADTDNVVLAALQRDRVSSLYDLIGGYVGFCVYFLERLPAPSAIQGIRLIVRHLEAISQPTHSGLTWHSGPELLPEWQREICPGGYYNLGVAHGVPGVLFILSEIAAVEVEEERALDLLARAMSWFLEQKRPTTSRSRSWFSSWIPTPGEPPDSRLAWCYGDLGIVAVLHQIARRSRRDDWQQFADRMLENCLAWPVEVAGVNDAPLCHGAIGNAHIFNRLYQFTGNTKCRDAAINYIEYGLSMRKSEGGVGGFFQYTRPEHDGPSIWEPSPAFLDGALGVALGLLSALTPVEPQWDRMLLLSSRTVSTMGSVSEL
jgi:hypothetical protein